MEWFPVKIIDGGYSLCDCQWGEGKGIFTIPFCRLYMVISGGAEVTIENQSLQLREGNVYFLPGSIPSRNSCHDFMEVFWLHFAPTSLELEYFFSHHKKIHMWASEYLNSWKNVYTVLKKFPFPDDSPELYRLHSLIIYLLADLITGKQPINDNMLFIKLRKALLFMDKEYLHNPSLAVIAGKANMAPNYFHRKFKELFPNFTPHSYMETKRMRDAKALIMLGHSLEETAESTGYSSVFYFSRAFKKVFSKSPSSVRKETIP